MVELPRLLQHCGQRGSATGVQLGLIRVEPMNSLGRANYITLKCDSVVAKILLSNLLYANQCCGGLTVLREPCANLLETPTVMCY